MLRETKILGFALCFAGTVFGKVIAADAVSEGTVLDGVTIVDTHDGSLKADRSILIVGDKIVRIASAGSMEARGSAKRIAASGKYVVPGYLDMHAHPLEPADAKTSLEIMVAYGITGYRQMGGSPELLAARKAGTLPTGQVPELLALPGMVIAGPAGADPVAIVAEIRKQKQQGADFIKIVDVGPEALFAALEEAHALGLPLGGHLPPTVDVRKAAKKGMTSVEHMGPTASILEACSTDETAIRARFNVVKAEGAKIAFDRLPLDKLKRLTANPALLWGPGNMAALKHIMDTYDEAKCKALAKALAKTNMWQVPTLIRERSMQFGNDAAFRNDPDLRYIPPADRKLWSEVGEDFDTKLTAEDRATLARLFSFQLKLTKLFSDAGVKMLAGSDYGGVWLIAGRSLHQEFGLLAEAGLSPLKILQVTTLDGAKFLHREATMGSVDEGKTADLVLLDANPIESVGNMHKISAVVLKGDYISRDKLDQIKDGVAKAVLTLGSRTHSE